MPCLLRWRGTLCGTGEVTDGGQSTMMKLYYSARRCNSRLILAPAPASPTTGQRKGLASSAWAAHLVAVCSSSASTTRTECFLANAPASDIAGVSARTSLVRAERYDAGHGQSGFDTASASAYCPTFQASLISSQTVKNSRSFSPNW
jgi:hypothetical protein